MICDVCEENYYEVLEFLKETKIYANIKKDVVLNGSILKQANSIIAMISYEINRTDNECAIIKYFVFRKKVSHFLILELLDFLIYKLKNNGIKKIIGLSNNKEMLQVFFEHNFYEIDPVYVYIDEAKLTQTIYKNITPVVFDLIDNF